MWKFVSVALRAVSRLLKRLIHKVPEIPDSDYTLDVDTGTITFAALREEAGIIRYWVDDSGKLALPPKHRQGR